jgi:hypothetical protein
MGRMFLATQLGFSEATRNVRIFSYVEPYAAGAARESQ